MEALKIQTKTNFEFHEGIEKFIKKKYPFRNEKYYYIVLKAFNELIRPSYKVSFTADAVIKECKVSRPTWYSYFNNIEDYYTDIIVTVGNVLTEYELKNFNTQTDIQNWSKNIYSLHLSTFLANTKILSSYFSKLKPYWFEVYDQYIDELSTYLAKVLQLNKNQTQLLLSNILNERILHVEKYESDPQLFYRYSFRFYSLLLKEQNS